MSLNNIEKTRSQYNILTRRQFLTGLSAFLAASTLSRSAFAENSGTEPTSPVSNIATLSKDEILQLFSTSHISRYRPANEVETSSYKNKDQAANSDESLSPNIINTEHPGLGWSQTRSGIVTRRWNGLMNLFIAPGAFAEQDTFSGVESPFADGSKMGLNLHLTPEGHLLMIAQYIAAPGLASLNRKHLMRTDGFNPAIGHVIDARPVSGRRLEYLGVDRDIRFLEETVITKTKDTFPTLT